MSAWDPYSSIWAMCIQHSLVIPAQLVIRSRGASFFSLVCFEWICASLRVPSFFVLSLRRGSWSSIGSVCAVREWIRWSICCGRALRPDTLRNRGFRRIRLALIRRLSSRSSREAGVIGRLRRGWLGPWPGVLMWIAFFRFLPSTRCGTQGFRSIYLLKRLVLFIHVILPD